MLRVRLGQRVLRDRSVLASQVLQGQREIPVLRVPLALRGLRESRARRVPQEKQEPQVRLAQPVQPVLRDPPVLQGRLDQE